MKEKSRFIQKRIGTDLFVIYDLEHQKYLLSKGKVSPQKVEAFFKKELGKEESYLANTPFRTIVVNLTEQCNLRCLYCHRYQKDYSANASMSEETLLLVMQRAYEYSLIKKNKKEKTIVQFHGGEPTLRLNVVKNVLDKFKDKLDNFELRIQTNATNISPEFIDLCRKYKIQVGVSIDGPPHLTSVVRRFGNGASIFPTVEKNIKLIYDSLPGTYISCLCVISSANVNKAKDVFDYLVKNQHISDISFLPLYPDFSPCLNQADTRIVPRSVEMIKFSKKIFDLWIDALKEGKQVCIPNFQIWFWNLAALNRGAILTNTCCGVGESMIFVDIDGTYYPCSPLSYEKTMAIGNVKNDSIAKIPKTKVGKLFQDRNVKSVSECRDCVFQGICRGACPANAFLKKGDFFEKGPFCEYWKGTISHILKRLAEDPSILKLIPDYTIRFF